MVAMDTLADTIRKRFRKSGWSMNKLAIESGVSYSGVHRFVNGTDHTTILTADQLCRALVLKLVASLKSKH